MSGTSARGLLGALIGFALALSLASTASASLEIHPAAVSVSRNDQVSLSYIGERDVSTILERPPPGFTVLMEKNENSTSMTGTVNIFPENATKGRYEYLLAFHSEAPYRLTLSVLRYNESAPSITDYGIQAYKKMYRRPELMGEIACTANVTTQVNISINVLQPKPVGPASPLTIAAFSSIPSWVIAVFAVSLSAFITTAILGIRDLKRARKGAWMFRQLVGATLIKHILFGSILAFLVTTIVLLGTFFGGLLTGVEAVSGGVLAWTLVVSTLLVVPVWILFLLAKWRGWYDLLG